MDNSPSRNNPLLSLVICSRNDDHGGKSLWRLETTLNFLADEAEASMGTQTLEVIVCDWGSEQPLSGAMRLSRGAARITRFLEVPVELAVEKQGNSPFCEVIANNAAIRRASGSYVGRIDQDTLVGRSFLRGFEKYTGNESEASVSPDRSFMFIGRRSIPLAFTRRTPQLAEVGRFVEVFACNLPPEGMAQKPWFDAPVGAVIMHRDLWEECRGYDEQLRYWGFMETDLGMRMADKYPLVNLEKSLGRHFWHLAHAPYGWSFTDRVKNERVAPSEFAPNQQNWGLSDYSLELRAAESVHEMPGAGDALNPPVASWKNVRAVFAEWCWQLFSGLGRRLRNLISGDRIQRIDTA